MDAIEIFIDRRLFGDGVLERSVTTVLEVSEE